MRYLADYFSSPGIMFHGCICNLGVSLTSYGAREIAKRGFSYISLSAQGYDKYRYADRVHYHIIKISGRAKMRWHLHDNGVYIVYSTIIIIIPPRAPLNEFIIIH